VTISRANATCRTCHDILKVLQVACATPWSPEERAAVLARAQESIRKTTAILAQREREGGN
jgi:hypothetical protein